MLLNIVWMWSIPYSRNYCSVSTSQGKNLQHHHGAVIKLGQKNIRYWKSSNRNQKSTYIYIYVCVWENVGNKGCVLANHGLDATVCFAIRFKVLIWRMRDLECYFSITTELKHNLYQDVDSQCICIYIIHIYKLLKVYLTNLEYDAPLQSRLQLYSTTDVRISHIIAFIKPHSGYLRTVPNGSEVPIFSRTISNYFRTICFFVPSIPPNGSERFRGSLCNLGAPARLRQVQTRLVQAKLFFYLAKGCFYPLKSM